MSQSAQPFSRSWTRFRRGVRWVFPPAQPVPDPSDRRPIIPFLKRGRFSFINPATHAMLEREFPECLVLAVDLYEHLLPRNLPLVAACAACAAKRYGGDWMRGRREFSECLERTPAFVRGVRRMIRSALAPYGSRLRFTFQTQALFDGSLPGVPHYLYTDHSHLANLTYPGFDRRQLFHADWIDEEREIFRAARRAFVMSGHVRDSLIDRYALEPGRVELVYAGANVCPPEILPDPSRFARRNILFVGVDWERKGGPELVEAFRAVRSEFGDATLTVVGCSPKVDGPGIRVVGRIPPDAVRRHFLEASVFCLPSRREPFGIAVVEAFAYGLPVVATAIGALCDMVEENRSGHLVEPHSPASLAVALKRLLAAPEQCAAFGSWGRERVVERYTWEATGKRIGAAIRASEKQESAGVDF